MLEQGSGLPAIEATPEAQAAHELLGHGYAKDKGMRTMALNGKGERIEEYNAMAIENIYRDATPGMKHRFVYYPHRWF